MLIESFDRMSAFRKADIAIISSGKAGSSFLYDAILIHKKYHGHSFISDKVFKYKELNIKFQIQYR